MGKYWLKIGPIEDDFGDGFTAEDRKEFLEDAGWQDVSIVRNKLLDNVEDMQKKLLAQITEDSQDMGLYHPPFFNPMVIVDADEASEPTIVRTIDGRVFSIPTDVLTTNVKKAADEEAEPKC